jgi:ribosomal protein L37AE/L43A
VKPKYNDYPLEECAKAAMEAMQRGATIYQKWTCEQCGDRVAGNTPNKFFTMGHHEDCGHITDLTKHGCNYLAIYGRL